MRNILLLILVVACDQTTTNPAPTFGTASGTYSESITPQGANACKVTVSVEAVEDASTPFLCPDCKILYRGPLTLTEGATCLTDLLGFLPTNFWIGWSADNRLFAGYG